MKKSLVTAALAITCLFSLSIGARAQGADRIAVTVPFEFVAGGTTLPAGEYRVSLVSANIPQLTISSYGGESAFLLPLNFAWNPSHQPTLSFKHIGRRYFLSQVKTLDGVYTMSTPPEAVALAQTTNPSTASAGSGTN
jgi:hypothetical protein